MKLLKSLFWCAQQQMANEFVHVWSTSGIHYVLFYRPGIKELLAHEFFAEDVGLRLEMVSRDEAVISNSTKVEFRLRVIDPKKRSNKHKENEAIQFDFDMATDNADEVSSEMVCIQFVVYHFTEVCGIAYLKFFNAIKNILKKIKIFENISCWYSVLPSQRVKAYK